MGKTIEEVAAETTVATAVTPASETITVEKGENLTVVVKHGAKVTVVSE